MSKPAHRPDMTRAIEALLTSPVTGRAVARSLSDAAAEMQARMVVADLRARRARAAMDRELDAREQERSAAGASPWARPN